jgi:tetratricopeptide (TPR) repeat protein
LYSLFSGDLDRNEEIDSGIIDIERIEKICSFNSFGSIEVFEALMNQKDSKKKSTGLWIYPSFINHSCVSNSFNVFYGDVMMIYAIKNLKKGEEITLSYLDPFEPYDKRLEKMKCFKFICNCELCALDRSDTFNDRRNEIFKKEYENLKSLMLSQNPEILMKAFEAAKAFVDKLRKTYTKRSCYQLYLHIAIGLLANLYQASGDYIKASILFNEATEICGDSFGHVGLHTQLKSAQCYKLSKKIEFAKNALNKAFESTKIRMGADKTYFKVILCDTLKNLDIYDLI